MSAFLSRLLVRLAWRINAQAVLDEEWACSVRQTDHDMDEMARESIDRAWKSSPAVAGSRALDHLTYDTDHKVGYYSDDPMSA